MNIEEAKRDVRLSELSRRVLTGAEQLAARLGHNHVGLSHLLLIMARERRSICAKLLRESGLNDNALEADLSKPRAATGGQLEDLIDLAVASVEDFGTHYTGTDHLLLTFATDPRGARLLRRYDANPNVIRQRLQKELSK